MKKTRLRNNWQRSTRGWKTCGTNLQGLEVQAEESRQRVLVLQSEWQALYDKAGEESVEKADAQPCHAPESEGMDDFRYSLGVTRRRGRLSSRCCLAKLEENTTGQLRLLTMGGGDTGEVGDLTILYDKIDPVALLPSHPQQYFC